MFGNNWQSLTASVCAIILAGLISSGPTVAQTTKKQPSATDQIARVTNKMQSKQLYKLEYKLQKGDTIRFTTCLLYTSPSPRDRG